VVTGKVTAGNDAYNANPDVELAVFGRFYCDTYGYPFIVHDSSAGDNLFEVDGGDCVKIDPEGVLGSTEFGGGVVAGGDISIPTTKKLYLDGGSNTYISESAGDTISFAAGMGGTALTLTTLQSTFSGSVRCGVNFQSSDGTSGANVVRSWEDPSRDVHTVTIKDGLITSWVIA